MNTLEKQHTLSLLVENQPGVLARVAHVLTRRGFNIEALELSPTEDQTLSLINMMIIGDDAAFNTLGGQLLKLIPVIQVGARN